MASRKLFRREMKRSKTGRRALLLPMKSSCQRVGSGAPTRIMSL